MLVIYIKRNISCHWKVALEKQFPTCNFPVREAKHKSEVNDTKKYVGTKGFWILSFWHLEGMMMLRKFLCLKEVKLAIWLRKEGMKGEKLFKM